MGLSLMRDTLSPSGLPEPRRAAGYLKVPRSWFCPESDDERRGGMDGAGCNKSGDGEAAAHAGGTLPVRLDRKVTFSRLGIGML